jgi:hypothetical protein
LLFAQSIASTNFIYHSIMKKLILAVLAAGSVFTASAQSKTTFGISGGVNFAKIAVSLEGTSLSASTGSLTTFSAGVFADAPVSTNFSIQPGLYYTGKGGSTTVDNETQKAKLYYLQLPVNVVYNVPVTAGKVFFGVGPYAAYGLSGTQEATGIASRDVKFGSDVDSDIKRTDFGATGLVGFNFKNGLLFKANYDLGLSNTTPNNEMGIKSKNRVFGVSVGYTF